jgi:hypothetical protein
MPVYRREISYVVDVCNNLLHKEIYTVLQVSGLSLLLVISLIFSFPLYI